MPAHRSLAAVLLLWSATASADPATESAQSSGERWAELMEEIGTETVVTEARAVPKTPPRNMERVHRCFEEARTQSLGLPDRVEVEVDVVSNRVLRVRVAETQVPHLTVRECLVGAVRGATLDEEAADRTFSWTFLTGT